MIFLYFLLFLIRLQLLFLQACVVVEVLAVGIVIVVAIAIAIVVVVGAAGKNSRETAQIRVAIDAGRGVDTGSDAIDAYVAVGAAVRVRVILSIGSILGAG